VVTSPQDNNKDTKRMAAITSGAGTAFNDRCAYVTLEPDYVTSQDVMTQTFCYAADELDDEPH